MTAPGERQPATSPRSLGAAPGVASDGGFTWEDSFAMRGRPKNRRGSVNRWLAEQQSHSLQPVIPAAGYRRVVRDFVEVIVARK